MEDCIFCKIVKGESPCHKVWEDENYMAFLNIFPNTEGITIVIPKKHYSSYVFNLPDDVYQELLVATRTVARKIDNAYEDVGRTAMVFEGLGVDHVHAKLYPLHGTKKGDFELNESHQKLYFEKYQGFVSTHEGPRGDDAWLKKVAEKIGKV